MTKTNISFYQTVTWTPQDRPVGDNFDAEFNFRLELILPWIKKAVECLTGIEDSGFVLKKALPGFQTNNKAVQSYKVTIKDFDDSQKEKSEFSVEIRDIEDTVFVLAEKLIYKRTRPLWIDAPGFSGMVHPSIDVEEFSQVVGRPPVAQKASDDDWPLDNVKAPTMEPTPVSTPVLAMTPTALAEHLARQKVIDAEALEKAKAADLEEKKTLAKEIQEIFPTLGISQVQLTKLIPGTPFGSSSLSMILSGTLTPSIDRFRLLHTATVDYAAALKKVKDEEAAKQTPPAPVVEEELKETDLQRKARFMSEIRAIVPTLNMSFTDIARKAGLGSGTISFIMRDVFGSAGSVETVEKVLVTVKALQAGSENRVVKDPRAGKVSTEPVKDIAEEKEQAHLKAVALRKESLLTIPKIAELVNMGVSTVNRVFSPKDYNSVSLDNLTYAVRKLQSYVDDMPKNETPKQPDLSHLEMPTLDFVKMESLAGKQAKIPAPEAPPVKDVKRPMAPFAIDQDLVDDIQAKMARISAQSSVVANVINYPLTTVVNIRDDLFSGMTDKMLESINERLDETLSKISKGQLIVPKEATILPPTDTITMPVFSAPKLDMHSAFDSARGHKEAYEMSKEFNHLVNSLLHDFAADSIIVYLGLSLKDYTVIRNMAATAMFVPMLQRVVMKLKNMGDPYQHMVSKSALKQQRKEINARILAVVEKLKPLTLMELSAHLGIAHSTLFAVGKTFQGPTTLETLTDIAEKLESLQEDLGTEPVKAPEPKAEVPEPVKAEEPPVVAKSFSDLKKLDLKITNIHPTGVAIPKYDEKEFLPRAKEYFSGKAKGVSNDSKIRRAKSEFFLKNRQRFSVISPNLMEVSKLTGINYTILKRVDTWGNPPSAVDQAAYSYYLDSIANVLEEIEMKSK